MIEPYAIVALSPRTFQMKRRGDALENTKRICRFMDTAAMVGAWEGFPARLVVIPEMAIQGMVANTPGNRAKEKEFAMTIPGPGDRRALPQGQANQSAISPPNFTW